MLFIAVLIVIGSVLTDRFARSTNFLNIYEQSTDLALVSLGQTLTILTGGIDLSVGSQISLLSVLTSGLINGDGSLVLPVCAGVIALGVLIGVVNGLGVVFLRIHPLIVTLGMGAVLQGVALLYALGPAGSTPDGFDALAYSRVGGLSVSATITVLLYLLVAFLMRRTATGRAIYATGDEPAAAVLLGLPVRRVTVLVYALCGFSVRSRRFISSRASAPDSLTRAPTTRWNPSRPWWSVGQCSAEGAAASSARCWVPIFCPS